MIAQANLERTSMLSASARVRERTPTLPIKVRSTSCAVSTYLPKIRMMAVTSVDV